MIVVFPFLHYFLPLAVFSRSVFSLFTFLLRTSVFLVFIRRPHTSPTATLQLFIEFYTKNKNTKKKHKMDARREELTTRYLDLAPNLTTLEITQTVDTFLKRHKNGCDNDTADRYLVDAILQQGAQKEAHGDVHMAQPTERAQQCSRSPIAAFIDSVIDGIVRRGDRGDNTNPAQPPAEDPVEPEVAGAEVEVPEEAAPTVHIDPMAVDMDMAGAQEEVAEETVEAQVEAVEEVVEVVEQARPPAPTLDLSEAQDMLAGYVNGVFLFF